MSEDKQVKLDELAKRIVDDRICPKLAASATQLVMGDGDPDADIVFIGEAPGKEEDRQGKPFVGPAGRLLNEMLTTIGLQRSDVYVSNIVKYRPPNNRDPLPEEKAAFLPYLNEQLETIRPKLIVTLGRHSMEAFLPQGLKISQIHGQPKRIRRPKTEDGMLNSALGHPPSDTNSWVILPLFHPAAALYNGSMKRILTDDFALIPSILKKIA